MNEEQWRRVDPIVQQALSQPVDARRELVERACGDDASLRDLALALLEADERAGEFLEQPAVELEPLLGPSTIGPYRVLSCLGSGGMGDVYLAIRDDDEFTRKVAIKVLAPGLYSPDLVRRFRSERQILASLDHPNIARMYEGGTLGDGRPYLVMEYVQGRPLHEYCERRALSLEQCIELFIEVCGAVDHAHRNLVLHLDLKPHNILVTQEGTPNLLDFGIAKLLDPTRSSQARTTRTGARPLTPQYASPEQHRQQPLTTASDVYSLGVVLYQLLSGRLPYGATGTTAEELVSILSDLPPSLPSARPPGAEGQTERSDEIEAHYDALRPRLRGDLDAIILKAIRHEPERRYASVAQLVDDLRRFLRCVPVHARRGTVRYRAGKLLRRRRGAVLAGALGGLTLIGFSVAMTIQASRLEQQRARAEQQRVQAEQQRARAEQQRARAEQQRRRAEVTSTFLVELVIHAGPARARDARRMTVGELLDHGRSILQHDYDSPAVDDMLRVTLARMFSAIDELDAADTLLRQALETTIERHGSAHLDVAEIWQALGWIEFLREGCQAAEPVFARALDIRESTLGPEHDAVIESRMSLARMVHCGRSYEQAAPHYDRAIEPQAARASSVREHLDVLTLRRQRATTRWLAGDRAGAVAEYEQIVEAFDAADLPSYPTLAEILVDLGRIYRLTDRPERGLAALTRARRLIRATMGAPHPKEAPALIGLARQHRVLGDDEAFERMLLEALALTEPTLGPCHPETQRAASWLRDLYDEQGRRGERARLDARVPPVSEHEPRDLHATTP